MNLTWIHAAGAALFVHLSLTAPAPTSDAGAPPASEWTSASPALSQGRVKVPGAPDSLEERLAGALEANPGIQLAEARLAEARAGLREARLAVTEEVIEVHGALERQDLTIASFAEALEHAHGLHESGMAPRGELVKHQLALSEAQGTKARLVARMRSLLGIESTRSTETAEVPQTPATRRLDAPEHIAAALEQSVKGDFEESPLTEVLAYLSAETNVPFVEDKMIAEGLKLDFHTVTVTLALGKVSMNALLTALVDLNPELSFVVRDYGILVTPRFQAHQFSGHSIPSARHIGR